MEDLASSAGDGRGVAAPEVTFTRVQVQPGSLCIRVHRNGSETHVLDPCATTGDRIDEPLTLEERAQASYTPKRRILTLIAFFLVEVGLVVGNIFLSDRCGWIGDRDACGLPAVSVVSFRISLISFMLAYVLQACPLMKPALELNVGRERWRLTWVWGWLRIPSASGLNTNLRGKVARRELKERHHRGNCLACIAGESGQAHTEPAVTAIGVDLQIGQPGQEKVRQLWAPKRNVFAPGRGRTSLVLCEAEWLVSLIAAARSPFVHSDTQPQADPVLLDEPGLVAMEMV